MPVKIEWLSRGFKQDFIEDLSKIFPWYGEEELTDILSRTGWLFLPIDLKLYLDNIYYPNILDDIMYFFSTPEKPIAPLEFYNFWMYLTPIERIEFKFADLK